MLLSLRKNELTSLFKEVRVFKEIVRFFQRHCMLLSERAKGAEKASREETVVQNGCFWRVRFFSAPFEVCS